ncbi:AidA/PixA family protein [Pseudomonas koreensis]|uniref:AidA/PixA family protein n=1 Tax=Pseudomonas koreensis TaxID=198620 RepID=UPI00320ADB71
MTSEPIPSLATDAQNVLLIVDAESLLSRYPTPSQDPETPTDIDDGLIFFAMGGKSKEIVTNDSKTKVIVEMDRDIHFRARSVSLIAEHSVVAYRMTVDDSSIMSAPQLQVHMGLTVPAPNPESPSEPGSRKADDHFWTCTPKTPGTAQCELGFMLVNQQCEVMGFFQWQIGIELTS